MELIDKLDLVLNILSTHKLTVWGIEDIQLMDIIKREHPEFGEHEDFQAELSRIMARLDKDGYAEIKLIKETRIEFSQPITYKQIVYKRTLNGEQFAADGGYKGEIKKNSKSRLYKITLDWLPHAIAVASLIVAFLSWNDAHQAKSDALESKQKVILLEKALEMHNENKALHQMKQVGNDLGSNSDSSSN